MSGNKKTAAALWLTVKPSVRQVQSAGGVLRIDDSREERPYTDETDSVGWQYGPAKAALLTGLNLMPAVAASPGGSLPVGCQVRAKTETALEQKTKKEQRRRAVSPTE